MIRQPHRLLLLTVLFAVILIPTTYADDCTCLDAPDAPCILHWLVLEEIVIPHQAWNGNAYVRSNFHSELGESGVSEAWIILQVDPIGPCKSACQQIYVWYEPNIAVSRNADIRLVPRGLAGATVFSMQECTPSSGYSIRFAFIEEDEAFSSALAKVARLTSVRGENTSPWAGETWAWSTRSLAADNSIDLIWEALTSGTSNDDITGIVTLTTPDLNSGLSQLHDSRTCLYADEGVGQIHISLHAYSSSQPGILGCTIEQANQPTQAEQHLDSETLETASTAAAKAPAGRTVHPAGTAPSGASKMTTINRSSTHRTSNGTKTLTERVVHIEFADYSDYIFWESVLEERNSDGTLRRRVVNRGDGASRDGSKRARVRGELTDVSRLRRTHRLYGFTPGSVYTPQPWNAPPEGEPAYDSLEIAVPSGSTLDLSAWPASSSAEQAITLYADDIVLPEGVEFADLFAPPPTVAPGVDEIALQVTDTVILPIGEQVLFVPLTNLSDETQFVTVQWTDTRGWATPAVQSILLPPGGSALIEIPILIPESAAADEQSSCLAFSTSGPELDVSLVAVQLLVGLPEDAPAAASSPSDATTAPEDDETPSTDESPDATTSPDEDETPPTEDPTAPSTDPAADVGGSG